MLFAVLGGKGKSIAKTKSSKMRDRVIAPTGLKAKAFAAAAQKALGAAKIPVNLDKFLNCLTLIGFEFTVRLTVQLRFFAICIKGDTSGDYGVIGLPMGAELSLVNVLPCEREEGIVTKYTRFMPVGMAAPPTFKDMARKWREAEAEARKRDQADLEKKAAKKGIKLEKRPGK